MGPMRVYQCGGGLWAHRGLLLLGQGVVVVALVAVANGTVGQSAALAVLGAGASLVVLARRAVLSAHVPVHVHRAHGTVEVLVVLLHDRLLVRVGLHEAGGARGNVRAGLGAHRRVHVVIKASRVGEQRLRVGMAAEARVEAQLLFDVDGLGAVGGRDAGEAKRGGGRDGEHRVGEGATGSCERILEGLDPRVVSHSNEFPKLPKALGCSEWKV